MTEVRSVGSRNDACLGLFATKDYKIGDSIIDNEDILIRFDINNNDNNSTKGFNDNNTKCNDNEETTKDANTKIPWLESTIEVPEDIVNQGLSYVTKFKVMIQVAIQYAQKIKLSSLTQDQISKLHQLYRPPLGSQAQQEDLTSPEQRIVHLSKEAMNYIKRTVDAKKSNSDDLTKIILQMLETKELQKVMLIWACNAFEGGRIYETISRINHSCNPNAVVRKNDNNNCNNQQSIIAASPISTGEEITISYLGMFLYADTKTRQQQLLNNKYFECHCERCSLVPDKAGAIPCPVRHPRILGGRQLEEDDQYDDDQTVIYTYPEILQKESSMNEDNQTRLNENPKSPSPIITKYISADGISCSSIEKEYQKLFQTSKSVIEKVISFLVDYKVDNRHSKHQKHYKKNNNIHKVGMKKDDDDDDDDGDSDNPEDQINNARIEQLLQLSSSVLGSRHWATNILMLLQLDSKLKSFHASLLANNLRGNQGNDDDDDEDQETSMETLAEFIDMLERIMRFLDNNVEIKLHKGHLLSDLIIGIARGLVSLGDAKSQKYAAEWLEKINDYVHTFESDGIQKVFETLQNAWKRKKDDSSDNDDNARLQKRAKVAK